MSNTISNHVSHHHIERLSTRIYMLVQSHSINIPALRLFYSGKREITSLFFKNITRTFKNLRVSNIADLLLQISRIFRKSSMSVQYIKSVIPDQDLQLFYGIDGFSISEVIFIFHQFALTRQIK